MIASGRALADVASPCGGRNFTDNGPIIVSDDKIKSVKLPLAAADGFHLSSQQLRDIFGIFSENFGSVPNRMVIPDLLATHIESGKYTVQGSLYIVEPVAWVPRVHHGTTIPVSVLKSLSINETCPVYESDMTAGEIPAYLATNGKLFGTITTRPTNKPICTPANSQKLRDDLPLTPIHQLTVFPFLKVRAIKEQAISFQISTNVDELEWAGTEQCGYWDKVRVSASRLSKVVESFQLHPLPLSGSEDVSELAYILPLPHVQDDGELEVTTLISKNTWTNWFIWAEQPWVPSNRQFLVPTPNNTVAFQPMTTWHPLDTSRSQLNSQDNDQKIGQKVDEPIGQKIDQKIDERIGQKQETNSPPRGNIATGDLVNSSGVMISSNEDHWYKIVLEDGSELGLGKPDGLGNGKTPVMVVPSGQGMTFRYQRRDGQDIKDQGWPMGQKGYLRGMIVRPDGTTIIQNMSLSDGITRLCMYNDNTNYGMVAKQISGNRAVLYGYHKETLCGIWVTPDHNVIGYMKPPISGLVCRFIEVSTSISKGWF